MNIETSAGRPIDSQLLGNYFDSLVNHFFKILPIREQNEESLNTYLQSLQLELLGCEGFVTVIQKDASYLTLLSILQYLIDNPDCSQRVVRREVFRAISICNKLKFIYFSKEC